MRTFALAVVLLSAVPSFAGMPPLEDKAGDGVSVGLPKGWTVKALPQKGTQMFTATRPPGKADSPALVVSVTSQGATVTDDQLAEMVLSQLGKTAKVLKRDALPGGGLVLLADGAAGSTPVRLGAVVMSKNGSAVTAMLVGPPGEFDALGGLELVTAVLASIKTGAAPAAAAPANDGKVSQADLAGVWDSDEGSVKQYANSSGGYAGAAVVTTHKIYDVAANGSYSEKFSGYAGGTASGGGRLVAQNYTGKWTLLPSGVLEVTTQGAASSYYTIVSFSRGADATMMMLAGPNYDRNAPPDPRCPCEKLYRAHKR